MDTPEDYILLLRLIVVGISIFGMVIWTIYYLKYKEPGAIAPITWLLNLVAFTFYRFIITDGAIEHTRVTDTWSILLHLHALALLIAAYYIFRYKKT